MKSCVSMRLLRALICIFIISVSTFSCVPHRQRVDVPYTPILTKPRGNFSVDFYLYKHPATSDFEHLKFYTRSEDPTIAAESSLMLGYYYLRDNRVKEASQYIRAYYNSDALSPRVKALGELWMMELAIGEDSDADAISWAASIKRQLSVTGVNEALSNYCTIMRIRNNKLESPYSCVESRLKSKGIKLSEQADLSTVRGQLNILITGSGDMLENSSGIFYHIQKHNLNHKIKLSKTHIDGRWDFWIDMDSKRLTGHGIDISFKTDLLFYIDKMDQLIPLNTCERIVFGTGIRYKRAAEGLKERLLLKGLSRVDILDVTEASSARNVRDTMNKLLDARYCAIGIGTQDDINNFIPSVRQYMSSASRQKLYVLEEVSTGEQLVPPYLEYYRYTNILPLVELNMSDKSKEFAQEYKSFSGKDASDSVFIGYDIMHYIYKHSTDGNNSKDPYITGIAAIIDGQVVREPHMYHVDKHGVLDEVNLRIDDNYFYIPSGM